MTEQDITIFVTWFTMHFEKKIFRNETQGPHVFSFTLLVMLGTMNLLALLPGCLSG